MHYYLVEFYYILLKFYKANQSNLWEIIETLAKRRLLEMDKFREQNIAIVSWQPEVMMNKLSSFVGLIHFSLMLVACTEVCVKRKSRLIYHKCFWIIIHQTSNNASQSQSLFWGMQQLSPSPAQHAITEFWRTCLPGQLQVQPRSLRLPPLRF